MIAEWLAKVMSVDVPRWTGMKPYPSAAGGKACRWMVSLFRWTFFVGGTPFAIWAACTYRPEPWVRGAGQVADLYFWSWIKTTDYAKCTSACRDLTFGMIIFFCFWIFWGWLMAGELRTSPDLPPRAYTGLPIAILTALYSLGLAAHGMQQAGDETLARWRKKNQPQ